MEFTTKIHELLKETKAYNKLYLPLNDAIKNHPLFVSGVSIPASAGITLIFNNEISKYFKSKLGTSPYWDAGLYAGLLIVLSMLVLTSVFLIILTANRALKREVGLRKKELEVLDTLGLDSVLVADDDLVIEDNYKIIVDSIINSLPSNLDIIVTTGYEIISMDFEHDNKNFIRDYKIEGNHKRKAPFHDILKDTSFKVRILLLHPECKEAQSRGSQVLGDVKRYKELIYRTVAYLNLIENPKLEYGFYVQEPIWKIIKCDTVTCVQSISSERKARKENWHIFSKKELSLTDGYDTLFEKKWKEKINIARSDKIFKKNIERVEDVIKGKMI